MKKLHSIAINFAFIALAAICFVSLSFGQAKSLNEEEFNKKIKDAFTLGEQTFPRRETEIRPIKTNVYEEGKEKPVETVLSETRIREFETKDRISYEFIKVTTKGKSVTKRVQIDSICYNSDGSNWDTKKTSCDMVTYSLGGGAAKKEFFVENGVLESKPMLAYRSVKTGEIYSDGKPPYISQYVYYIDALGRIIKTEHLTGKGDAPSVLQNSVKYDYDITVKPIEKPFKISRKTKQ